MLSWEYGSFSLDANVRIEAQDRAGLERLIRYCARPIFSGERLDCIGDKLRYILPKPTADGQTVLLLKPSELLDKLAGLIPPPRRHRHHYHGVLASNSPLRSKIAALANKEIIGPNTPSEKTSEPFQSASGSPIFPNCQNEKSEQPEEFLKIQATQKDRASEVDAETQAPQKKKKEPSKASLFRWAMLLARIFEVLPLSCPKCNHPMRIISFIEDPHTIRKILTHINEPTQPPPTPQLEALPSPNLTTTNHTNSPKLANMNCL